MLSSEPGGSRGYRRSGALVLPSPCPHSAGPQQGFSTQPREKKGEILEVPEGPLIPGHRESQPPDPPLVPPYVGSAQMESLLEAQQHGAVTHGSVVAAGWRSREEGAEGGPGLAAVGMLWASHASSLSPEHNTEPGC